MSVTAQIELYFWCCVFVSRIRFSFSLWRLLGLQQRTGTVSLLKKKQKNSNCRLTPSCHQRERNGNLWGYHFKAATRSFHFVDSGDPCGRKQHEHHRLLSHKDIHLVGVCISFDLKKDKTVSEPVRGPLRYIWVEDLNAQLHIITNILIATLLFYLIQSSIKTWQWFV